jgi:phage terminase small subunit
MKSPKHLSPEAARWWRSVNAAYHLEPHQAHLLRLCCDALDRGEQARKALAAAGSLFFTDAHGNLKPHPCVLIEHNAALRLARLMKALGVDVEEARPGPGRPTSGNMTFEE